MSKSQTIAKRTANVVPAKKMKAAQEPKPYNPYRAAAERMHNHPGLEAYLEAFEEQRRLAEQEFVEQELTAAE